MNILILSVGTRNKIIQYFKKAVGPGGKIVATDMAVTAPAVYEADVFYQVPPVSAPDYLRIIFDICQKEKIRAVLSLIDPELSILALHKDEFESLGVTVIGSSYELCERALDKMQMYHWLSDHGYRCAKSYDSRENFSRDLDKRLVSFPVFVKPICGSASADIHIVEDKDTLDFLWQRGNKLMVQEYLRGQEIGADVYIDMLSHEVVSIFTKKKLLMRAGETDKSVSFKDPVLFSLIEKFVKESGWVGQIDIDLFEIDGSYYFSEVNPRFGGGYPHAYECGVNHMALIRNNLAGITNQRRIGNYDEGIYMMKYNEIAVRKL